ncbi:MAG: transglutaminase-like domain-containing protein [Acidobacteriota bacterium]
MLFRNRNLKAGTAIVALASFTWMSSGGNVWAESRAARRDPAFALRQLADNPRLALSREEKNYLRRFASRMETRSQPDSVAAAVPSRPVHPVLGKAAEMHALAAELDRLPGPVEAERIAEQLKRVHRGVLQGFEEVRSRLLAAGLPPLVLARHDAAQRRYLDEIEAVFQDLDAAARAKDPRDARKSAAAAAERLRKSTSERPNEEGELDPSRLPFRRAQPVRRQPGMGKSLDTLHAGSIVGAVASLTPPTPADLAATEDAQITPEIRALAASLGNQPVRIYDWVRNNIEFYPTYGSVQGSQMTLDAKRGNAFDTASLLIALLRAAGVPARYVTGTVEVPVEAAKDWVGGAATPNVAQQILGQGGIPNVALINGGVVSHLRIDHVWVEAFVDNIPSRGAVQREGDTWVPMDASFKLHQFTPRSTVFADNPISSVMDPAGVADVDEALGMITNVHPEVLEQRMETWVQGTDQGITAGGVERTRDGLLGKKTILPQTNAVLPASLPYQVLVRGSAVSVLPAGVRHTVTLNGFASQFDRSLGHPSFSVKLSLPALNSQRLGIEFDPATQADADTLAAARNGGASSLPVYLVDVVPVVRLDGQTLGAGGPVQMGGSFFVDVLFQGPDGPTTIPYQIVAGDEIVAGITGNGVTKEIVQKRFEANPVNNAPEYLHQVQLHYWMETDYLGEIAASGAGVHQLRLPSVGFFSSPLTVSYLFGAPRSGIYQSRIMDVKHSLMGAAGQDPAQVVNFMKQAGFQGSYLEGAVFDQLETIGDATPTNRGISAIHLISAAMAQGIPIYRVTSANAAVVLPRLQLSSAVENDISRAVSQGKTVLTAERNVDFGNWIGVGYIIHDESTGAGAYLISGGLNGGGLIECIWELVPIFVEVLLFILLLILIILLIAAILAALAGTAPAWAPAAAAIVLFLLLLQGVSPTSPAPTTA